MDTNKRIEEKINQYLNESDQPGPKNIRDKIKRKLKLPKNSGMKWNSDYGQYRIEYSGPSARGVYMIRISDGPDEGFDEILKSIEQTAKKNNIQMVHQSKDDEVKGTHIAYMSSKGNLTIRIGLS